MIDIEEVYDIYESYEKINSEIRKYFGRENQAPLSNLDERDKRNISNKIREYNDFVKQVDILNLNPDVIFSDITDKRYLLKNIMHYRGLKGGEKIDNCPDEQIGKAFQNVYKSACKALNIN